jgi:hypothetical protein
MLCQDFYPCLAHASQMIRKLPVLLWIMLAMDASYADSTFSNRDSSLVISVGGNISTVNSSFSIDKGKTGNKKQLDLEDDLGIDETITMAGISGRWKISPRHRLRFSYQALERRGKFSTDETLNFDKFTVSAGAEGRTTFDIELAEIDYSYVFYQAGGLETAVSIGIYNTRYELGIDITGEIITSENSTSVDTAREKVQVSKVMPLIGASAKYYFTPKLAANASVFYLEVDDDDVKGNISSFTVNMDYSFARHWGVGIAATYFGMDLDIEGDFSKKDFDWDYSGVGLYLNWYY